MTVRDRNNRNSSMIPVYYQAPALTLSMFWNLETAEKMRCFAEGNGLVRDLSLVFVYERLRRNH